jgi:hypothetical protein
MQNLEHQAEPPSRSLAASVARWFSSPGASIKDAGIRAYSCGAVAEFHRLPEHPVAQVRSHARTRLRNVFRRALAPCRTGNPIRKSRYKSSTSASQSGRNPFPGPGLPPQSIRPFPTNLASRNRGNKINDPIVIMWLYTRCTTPQHLPFLPRLHESSFQRRWGQAQSADRR